MSTTRKVVKALPIGTHGTVAFLDDDLPKRWSRATVCNIELETGHVYDLGNDVLGFENVPFDVTGETIVFETD